MKFQTNDTRTILLIKIVSLHVSSRNENNNRFYINFSKSITITRTSPTPPSCGVTNHVVSDATMSWSCADPWDREFETYVTTSSPDPLSFSSHKQNVDFYPFVTSSGFDMLRVTWNMNTLYALPYNTIRMTYNPRQYKVCLPFFEILAMIIR